MERRTFLRNAAGVTAVSSMEAESVAAAWETAPGSITDVRGIRVGHFTDARRPTGCTVVLFDEPAVCGVDVRGSAPGTRETDLLNPINTVDRVNAILLSGGSAYGLDAASGVVRFLEERNVGFHAGNAVVPIVPAAILFDLFLGDPKIHPDAAAGYTACQAAGHENIAEGSVGAGAGATVGKLFGLEAAMKSGIGTASWTVPQTGLAVGALVAVNAAGDVVHNGRIIAGARNADGPGFLDSMARLMNGARPPLKPGRNTTLGLVITNAALTKVEATKVAQMAHDGLARTIDPVHTLVDGDTIFAAATGRNGPFDAGTVGAIAAEVIARAVYRAVAMATGVEGYPARRDLTWLR
jgi:L-aminopeptidase/D-esterase-like protein